MSSTATRPPATPRGEAPGPGPIPPKEMGSVLGVAVLLDAFLVRLVLLPVLLRLTGHAAWWTPAWLRRVLPTISFAHD